MGKYFLINELLMLPKKKLNGMTNPRNQTFLSTLKKSWSSMDDSTALYKQLLKVYTQNTAILYKELQK